MQPVDLKTMLNYIEDQFNSDLDAVVRKFDKDHDGRLGQSDLEHMLSAIFVTSSRPEIAAEMISLNQGSPIPADYLDDILEMLEKKEAEGSTSAHTQLQPHRTVRLKERMLKFGGTR